MSLCLHSAKVKQTSSVSLAYIPNLKSINVAIENHEICSSVETNPSELMSNTLKAGNNKVDNQFSTNIHSHCRILQTTFLCFFNRCMNRTANKHNKVQITRPFPSTNIKTRTHYLMAKSKQFPTSSVNSIYNN